MTLVKYSIPLLAIVLLVPAGMDNAMAQEVPGGEELEANGVGPVGIVNEVNDRPWANSTEQIEAHRNFKAFVDHEMQDSYTNNERKAAGIIIHNIVTEIGKELSGYELAGLIAKLQILDGIYNPTSPERKMHEWAFFMHDIPEDRETINARIDFITNNADDELVNDLVDAIHRLVNIGSVSRDLKDSDRNYWFLLSVKTACDHDPICSEMGLGPNDFDEPTDPQIIPVTSYGFHWGYILADFKSCQGNMESCESDYSQYGTGIISNSFSSPEHVISRTVNLEMYANGSTDSTAVVTGQVTEPLPGTILSAYDRDGYVITDGYVSNPNTRSAPYIEIGFTSYAYTR